MICLLLDFILKNEIISKLKLNKKVRRLSKLSNGQYKFAGKKLFFTLRLRVGKNKVS